MPTYTPMLRLLLPLHCGSWFFAGVASEAWSKDLDRGAVVPTDLQNALSRESECHAGSPEDDADDEGDCAFSAQQLRARRTKSAGASSVKTTSEEEKQEAAEEEERKNKAAIPTNKAEASSDAAAEAAYKEKSDNSAKTASASTAAPGASPEWQSSTSSSSSSASSSSSPLADLSTKDAAATIAEDELSASSTAGRGVNRRFFLWISDIHADPFYGVANSYRGQHATCKRSCPLQMPCTTNYGKRDADEKPMGSYGCDPPIALWESALKAASREAAGAEFVLFTGDAVRHKQDELLNPAENVTNIIGDISALLVDNFPEYPNEKLVLGTLGNDDTPHNYEIYVTDMRRPNPWLEKVSRRLEHVNAMGSERKDEYEYGGFFKAKVGGLTVLSINTLMYSVKHKPMFPAYPDPFGQFEWLRAELQEAHFANEHVWIVGHIPPGLETYGFAPLWQEKYLIAYLNIVQDPILGAVIKAQLFGHVHADEVRILPQAPMGAGPMLLVGAVSPIYYENPSFRLMEYDEDSGALLNVKVFWANLSESYNTSEDLHWSFGYDFLGSYPSLKEASSSENGLFNAGMAKFGQSLESSWESKTSPEWPTYVEWYKTRVLNDLMLISDHQVDAILKLSLVAKRRAARKYFCALNITSADEFRHCVGLQDYDRVDSLGAGPLDAGDDDSDPFRASDLARARHWISVATDSDKESIERLINEEAASS